MLGSIRTISVAGTNGSSIGTAGHRYFVVLLLVLLDTGAK